MYGVKIEMVTAKRFLRNIEKEIRHKYRVKIIDSSQFQKGDGGVANLCDGSLNMYVNKKIDFDKTEGEKRKYANLFDFVNYIRLLYHEEQHIKQTITKVYSTDDDAIQMATKNLSCERNINYYGGSNIRYTNNLAEIDAEREGVLRAYLFLKDNVTSKHAEEIICDFVNDKIKTCDYFVDGEFDNISDIFKAFDQKYENAKFFQISHPIKRLGANGAINPRSDECVKYLQKIMQMSEQNCRIVEIIESEHDVFEHDRMIASIVHHLHPEIDYKRLYPCLKNEDLSPESVFGQKLPTISDIKHFDLQMSQMTTPICFEYDNKKLDKRIRKADKLHKKYDNSEMQKHDDKLININEQLDESLASLDKDKKDFMEFY